MQAQLREPEPFLFERTGNISLHGCDREYKWGVVAAEGEVESPARSIRRATEEVTIRRI